MFTTQSPEQWSIRKSDENTEKLLNTSENELASRYDLERCCDWIRKNNYQTTCLQFPEPLLNDGTSIALYLQKVLERRVYVLADTSYGSCCVDEVAAQHVDADSIIHFGHACLSPVMKLPVLYIFEKEDLDLKDLHNSFNIFREDNQVIVFYDDVFHHLQPEICSVFEEEKNVTISTLCLDKEKSDDKHIICGRSYDRNSSQADVSAVFIGNESITLQNLVLGLPEFTWYRYSKESKLEEYNLNRNKFLMQRSHLVEKVKAAKVIGILIGTLGIKSYLDAVDRIKVLAKKKGKKHYTVAVGKPNVAKLANFPEIDVFVYIACQENLLLKDFKDYYKPLVSLFEVEMALGDRPYSIEYSSSFREVLPGGSFHREVVPGTDVDEPVLMEAKETSLAVVEREPGTLIEYAGAQFLSNRTWRGLEQKSGETEVCKVVKGRSGIPQNYENELETLSEGKD